MVDYSLWDADGILGCACEDGFEGYDCSKRSCPKGADPVAVDQDSLVPEIQTVTCTCEDTCSGTFMLKLGNMMSAPIAHDAVATTAEDAFDSVQALIEGMRAASLISGVSFSTGTEACSDAGVDIAITFRSSMGDVPILEAIFDNTLTSTASTPTITVATTQTPTVTAEVCSGRGTCDTSSGLCTCDDGFGPSDGDGATGNINDCGYYDGVTTLGCPNDCSSKGVCSGSPYYTCTCYAGFEGADCSQRSCPVGVAWWDEPSATDTAHAKAECSNRGTCDRSSGLCTCQTGFTGSSCSKMTCPTRDGVECSGRGQCLTNAEFATVGRFGGALANDGENEVQQVVCTATSGSIRFTFRYAASAAIAYDVTESELRDALDKIPSLGLVSVSFTSPYTSMCDLSGNNLVLITFPYDYGDLPLLTSDTPASVTITEITPGSRVTYGQDESSTATWDADKIRSCYCDGHPDLNKTSTTDGDLGKYFGPACALRTCPYGSDPRLGDPLRYRVSCAADGGSLYFSFSGATTTTALDPATAVPQDIVTVLYEMGDDYIQEVFASSTASKLCDTTAQSTDVYIRTPIRDEQVVALAQDTATSSITNSGGTASVSVTLISDYFGVENQTLSCAAEGGTFTLSFRGYTTAAIAYSATPNELEEALQAISSIGIVTATSASTTICDSAAVTTVISFDTELGDVPLLTIDNSLLTSSGTVSTSIVETDKGLTKSIECSGRGTCDRTLGVCKCIPPYVSSNGLGERGSRGDCGAIDYFYYEIDPKRALIEQTRRNNQLP